MSKAWDDLGARPLPDTDPYWDTRNAMQHRETYAEALARSVVVRPTVALTEQELAEREVAARERMRQHDRRFSEDFITGPEQQLVSRVLARQLGSYFNDGSDTPGDDE